VYLGQGSGRRKIDGVVSCLCVMDGHRPRPDLALERGGHRYGLHSAVYDRNIAQGTEKRRSKIGGAHNKENKKEPAV